MPNWKKVIVSGSDASLNSLNVTANIVAQSFTGSLLGTASYASQALSSSYALTASYAATASSANTFIVRNSLTASGLNYPAADNGEESFMQTDGNGNLSLQYVKTIYEEIYNGEATNILKGTPVYVSGSVGAASIVYRADASNAAKMPVVYVSADTIAPGATGRGIALGLIKGVNTTGYPAGTEIYVGVGGGWTSTRPTGSAIVQVLGYVTKEGNGGQGVVLNPGPSNLPNIQSGYVWIGNSNSYPVATATSSIQNVISSSYALNADLLDGLNSTVFAQTGSNTFTGAQYITNTTNATSFDSTSSLYTDGGLRVTKDTYISSSLYINGNLTVYGTSSITYITSSIYIGGNRISLNTDSPSIRFAGIDVYDSGSNIGVTGSLLWDSLNNRWVYSNPSGSSYDSGMLISGPRNTSGLGNEQGTINNRVVKGQGGDHITSSQITDDGTTVSIPGNLTITGSLVGNLTGSLQGTASWATNASTASYVLNAVSSSYTTLAQTANTASYIVTAQTASYVNPLVQDVSINGVLSIGATVSSSEGNLFLGPKNTVEGGQIFFQAGTSYTSASMLDVYNDGSNPYFRILRGNNTSSDAIISQFNLHTKQFFLPAYNSLSSFPATGLSTKAFLGIDSNGAVITTNSVSGSLGVGTTGSAVVGRIDASNDVVAFSTSDNRLKENIIPISNALEKIDKIGGYTFDWKQDKDSAKLHGFSGHDVGVIAQEIEKVLPEIVTTRDNGFKAVKYEKIVPLLIQAIKELQQEINELKANK